MTVYDLIQLLAEHSADAAVKFSVGGTLSLTDADYVDMDGEGERGVIVNDYAVYREMGSDGGCVHIELEI